MYFKYNYHVMCITYPLYCCLWHHALIVCISFLLLQMQAGCRFADHEPVAVCEPCRKVRRHPYQFAHRHGTLAVSIQSPQCHKFNVSADVVLAKGAKLYPFVVLKRPGDCVEITDK